MRYCWLLFLWFSSFQWTFAQTFFATPGPLKEQELAFQQANECYLYFENPTGDTLQLRWKRVETSYPAAWDIDLCDYGSCYTGIPASALMNPAPAQEQPYLKLIVQPDTAPGNGWLWFRVWEEGNPANFEDVFFSVFTTGTSAVSEPLSASVRVFPNPAAEWLSIQNNTGEPMQATLCSPDGLTVWAGRLPAGQTTALQTLTWPPGLYYLRTPGKTQSVLLLH